MKRIITIISLAAAALVSCNKEPAPAAEADVNIKATYSQADFQTGDQLAVFTEKAAASFKAGSVSSATEAVFSGKISTAESSYLVAVYPEGAISAEDASKVHIDLSEQNASSFSGVAYARITKPDFSKEISAELKPVTGTLEFTLNNGSHEELTLVSVEVSSSSKMFYAVNACNMTASSLRNNYSKEAVKVLSGSKVVAGSSVVIPVRMFPGGTQEGDGRFTLTLKNSKDASIVIAKDVTFQRPAVGATTSAAITLNDDMVDTSVKHYSIIYAKSLSEAAVTGIFEIANIIYDKTGVRLTVSSDDAAQTDNEILFGATNRQASKAVECPTNGYVVKYDGDNLIVKGGSDDLNIAALYSLERDVIENESYLRSNAIKFNTGINVKMDFGETLAMRHMISQLYDFEIKEEMIKKIVGEGTCTVAQGACTDGTNYYVAFRKANESQVIVYKYRLSDHAKVGSCVLDLSGISNLCHANDMVYVPDTGLIHICGWANTNSPKTNLLLDAATMTQKPNLTGLTHSPTAISYNVKEKIFQSRSGANVYKSEAGFKNTVVVNSAYEKYGYTNQGAGGDDMYVYYPVNNGTNSQLLVFDWGGQQLWNVQINNKIESESLFVVGATYYWWTYSSSAGYLYTLTPKMRYTYGFKGGWSDIKSPALR